jgi:pimeloyl-ACP methyl ester carboxylesterase
MSTTGSPSVGQQHPDALQILLTAVPSDRAAVIDQDVASWRVCGSPGFAFDEDAIRERAGAAYDRAFHPEGTGRQLVAVIASGDRTERLGAVHVPTLVIHGEEDPLIDVSGGRATAAAIPGARLKIVPGMGHDLPPVLFDEFADDIAACAVGAHA